jgi:N,N-dimethylformamidase beta subunit-like, C-terminal
VTTTSRAELLRGFGCILVGLAGIAARPSTASANVGPAVRKLRIGNGGAPFAGDDRLLATVTPGRREGRAIVRFALEEAAQVRLSVVETAREGDRTVWSRVSSLGPGEHALAWRPKASAKPRTYLVRIVVTTSDGRRTVVGRRYPGDGCITGPVVRILGIDAATRRASYRPGDTAAVRVEAAARKLTLQICRCGLEEAATRRNDELSGRAVGDPIELDWRSRSHAPAVVHVRIGAWPSGLYYAKLTAADGRVGFAPFVVRPARLGESRVAVVLPTNTWQAYNFFDADRDGIGDTWYASWRRRVVELGRPFLNRGVPPRFKAQERAFLHWVAQTNRSVDVLADDDLERVRSGDALRRAYDLVVFPGHSEYVTRHAYDVVERYRNLGGNLLFLSANNFFWRVDKRGRSMRRVRLWRELGRPEARLVGVQYLANDRGGRQAPFVVRNAAAVPWLWSGTSLGDGDSFGQQVGGFGTEIDARTRRSPRKTRVVARIPHAFGRGLTAEMVYYETRSGARVFAAGALDFGGSVHFQPMRRMLENIWERLAPEDADGRGAVTRDVEVPL